MQAEFQTTDKNKKKPKHAIVAAVQLPNVSDIEFEASLTELSGCSVSDVP